MLIACSKCCSHEITPSMPKDALERLLSAVFIRAYRCQSCGSRFRSLSSSGDYRAIQSQALLRLAVRDFAPRASM